VEYGMHESGAWYEMCENTARDVNLYHADQDLQGNTAKFTRQNPNGGRRGLECPEERDYYPYWNPNQPWNDAAIMVSDTSWCEYFQENSQNVRNYSYCRCTNPPGSDGNPCPIGERECRQNGRGEWRTPGAKGLDKPECVYHPFARDNHLGNTMSVGDDGIPDETGGQPEMAHYDWTIPADAVGKHCVLRMRYNMSTADYNSHEYAEPNSQGVGIDTASDCPYVTANDGDVDGNGGSKADTAPQCYADILATSVPLVNRPYVDMFEDGNAGFPLALAINTHQTGRTFQDRSYVFKVEEAPKEAKGKTIWNLNLRGRRGNIVQSYPSVEYDFVPSELNITTDDYVHIQLHGSDFNTARNANNGEGWQYSDRTNLVQSNGNLRSNNYPSHHSEMSMFTDTAQAKDWALLGQQNNLAACGDYNLGDNSDGQANSPDNCAKLNRAPNRFPADPAAGMMKMKSGQFNYMSTRNNNFSNRSQKGVINVLKGYGGSGISTGAAVGIAFGVIFGVLGIAGGIAYYFKINYMFCFEKSSAYDVDMAYQQAAI